MSRRRRGPCTRTGPSTCSGRSAGGPQVPLGLSAGRLASNRGNSDARDDRRAGGVAHRPGRAGASRSRPTASEPARPATGTPVPATGTPVPATGTPVPVAPEAQSPVRLPPPAPTVTVPPGRPDDPLATRRNAVRVVNGKTFRLVAGDWIDAAYRPSCLVACSGPRRPGCTHGRPRPYSRAGAVRGPRRQRHGGARRRRLPVPPISPLLSEGLRPSDSPTRALARRFAGSLRSRGSLAAARSRCRVS